MIITVMQKRNLHLIKYMFRLYKKKNVEKHKKMEQNHVSYMETLDL